jgi:catechol 2,3-dioxygenase-like lactoylglutathione lyase family enzyme
MMSHPPINSQITFLYTSDLPSTAHFYEDVVGMTLALDHGTCRIYRTGEGSYVGFCQRDDISTDHADVIFTLVTPQVDEWYQYLLNHGVTFEKPPALNCKFNIYHCFFRDVNGYLIEIQQFLDENWNR